MIVDWTPASKALWYVLVAVVTATVAVEAVVVTEVTVEAAVEANTAVDAYVDERVNNAVLATVAVELAVESCVASDAFAVNAVVSATDNVARTPVFAEVRSVKADSATTVALAAVLMAVTVDALVVLTLVVV